MTSDDANNYLEETELLIQLVRGRPALYDRSRSDFKDPAYKQFMWQEVGDLMGCTSQEIHKRWISLRDRYTSEHRKLKKIPAATPSNWHFYESMSFLEKQIIERRRILPYIYGPLRGIKSIESATAGASDVKMESFDSRMPGDSPWDGVVDNTEMGYSDNTDIDQAITPEVITAISASKRRRSISPDALLHPVNNNKTKLEDGLGDRFRNIRNSTKPAKKGTADCDAENADQLFGKMIGVMIAELNADDKDRAKIHIMSYLCTHGYKNESD